MSTLTADSPGSKIVMQNAECTMHNCGVRFAHDIDLFPKEIPSFCIMHYELCIIKREMFL